MAFPTTAVIDDFNRADQRPPGGDWATTELNGSTTDVEVIANQLRSGNPSQNCYLNTVYGPDTEVYIEIPTLPNAGSYIAIWARLKDLGSAAWDGYAIVVIQGAPWVWSIRRYDNGTGTVLGANINGPNLTAGDSVGLEVIGDGISAYHKTGGTWTLVGSRTDATYAAAGRLGFESGDELSRYDNMGGGTVVAGSSENLTPGGAVAAGNALTSGGALPAGIALAAGSQLSSAEPMPLAGASAGGVSPGASADIAPGGAVAQGVALAGTRGAVTIGGAQARGNPLVEPAAVFPDEETRAREYRRMMKARSRWENDQRHRAFPGDPAAKRTFDANWQPITDPIRGWDPPEVDDREGLQIP